MEKPVEASVIDQGSSISQTFLNAPKARLAGLEVEAKKYFEFPDLPYGWLASKRWLAQANYTFTNSEVLVEDGDEVITQNSLGVAQPASFYIVDGSRLQGQSDHLANLQLCFEDDANRTQATLLVTYASERISARGRPGEPDIVQEPGVNLDLVVRQGLTLLGREFTASLEARNLLGEDFEEFQEAGSGRVDINRYDVGTSVSLGLSARF
jgi:outer membrane receptor protein involved in Fe transport